MKFSMVFKPTNREHGCVFISIDQFVFMQKPQIKAVASLKPLQMMILLYRYDSNSFLKRQTVDHFLSLSPFE